MSVSYLTFRYFEFVDDPLHTDFIHLYTISTYLSPFHVLTLTKSEKSKAKEAIKNKLSLMWFHSSGGQQEGARVKVTAQHRSLTSFCQVDNSRHNTFLLGKR